MKSIGMRSLRMPLAILMAFALVVSGIIYASPLFAARADAPPAGINNRADVVISDITMKKWGGNDDTTGIPGRVYINDSVLVKWKWHLDDTAPRPKPNDSFVLRVPNELGIRETNNFPLLVEGETIGTCYPERKLITCVFGDQVDLSTKSHLAGEGHFAAAVNVATGETVSFDANGNAINVPMPENTPATKKPRQWNPEPLHKSHDGIPSDARFLRWYIVFSGKALKDAAAKNGGEIPNPLVIKDTLSGPQTFTDMTEFYIIQTKENPELQWTTLIGRPNGVGGDSTPAVPGRFHEGFEPGTFKLTADVSPDRKTATYKIHKLSGEWHDDVNYKFLYIAKHDGKVVESVVYKNNVEISDGENAPFFTQTRNASYKSSAGATATMREGYGSFRVGKTLGGPKREEVLKDPNRKALLKVHWTLPDGKNPSHYPDWNAPANPVDMPLTFDALNAYPNGGNKPFPVGTTIRLVEDAAGTTPALPAGVEWGEPLFTIGDQSATNEISFVIESAKVTNVQLENTAKLPPSVSVGDYVWFDANKDGKQDPSENGLAGAVLKLTYADDTPVTNVEGQVVDTYTTKDNGYYVFDKLPVLSGGKKYKVTMVTPPAGYVPTVALADGVSADLNSNTDSVVSEEALDTDLARDMTLDFGFIKPSVSVGNLVWFDANKNGLQDAGESGIENVTLTISRSDNGTVNHADGTPFQADELTTTTNPQGEYSFGGLEPLTGDARYVVTVTAPEGYQATEDRRGNDTEKDSDAKAGKATAKELSVNGASDNSLDFGFIKPAVSVGDFVWFDANKNGLQDADESGIENVTLTISRSDDAPVKTSDGQDLAQLTTTTNNQGHYEFTNLQALPAGTSYIVTVTTPEGYQPTEDKQGSDTEKDSEAKAGKARSKDLTTDGASDNSLDFGFIKPAVSVGNFVWFDTNKNGLQDDNEPGIKDVILTISRSDKKPVKTFDGQDLAELTVTTNEQGLYEFTNLQALPAGTSYVVTVTKLPRGLAPTVEADDDDAA
ncbi:SdrD B-like domain-containing protein, partial [Schaalia canis]